MYMDKRTQYVLLWFIYLIFLGVMMLKLSPWWFIAFILGPKESGK